MGRRPGQPLPPRNGLSPKRTIQIGKGVEAGIPIQSGRSFKAPTSRTLLGGIRYQTNLHTITEINPARNHQSSMTGGNPI